MAASEEAYGAGHPATFTVQPAPTTRRMELSGEAHGEDQPGVYVSSALKEPKRPENCQRDT